MGTASEEFKPSLHLVKDCWILEMSNGVFVKITEDILSMEADKLIAAQLGVTPANAWVLKNEAIKQWWPRNLEEVRNLFPAITGEDETVKLMLLSLFSTKLKDPSDRIMGVIVEAGNSAGKSFIVQEILRPLRLIEGMVMEFSRITGAYLERKFSTTNLERRVLYIQEAEEAPYQLHLALSEGKLRVGLVARNGRDFEPVEIECEGRPFLILTTTNWSGASDLIHRCITVNLDESTDQTKRILERKAKLHSDPHLRRQFMAFRAGCEKMFLRLWHETPNNVDVVIPFLPLLEEKFRDLNELDLKLRRDFDKMVSLIKAHALLFHKHRVVLVKNDGFASETIIIATIEDLKSVLPLVNSTLRQVITSLSEKEERVLRIMREEGQEFYTYTELGRLTGIPTSTLRHSIIPRLEHKGYVLVEREGRAHHIELGPRAKGPLVPNLSIDEARAQQLVDECLSRLKQLGYIPHCRCQMIEKSPETALYSEKESAKSAADEITRKDGIFGENKREEGVSKKEPKELIIQAATEGQGILGQKGLSSGPVSNWHAGDDERYLKDEWGAIAIPIEVRAKRYGRVIVRTLDLVIEFRERAVDLPPKVVEELVKDLSALYGEEAVFAKGHTIHVERNISGGEVAFLVKRIEEKIAHVLDEISVEVVGSSDTDRISAETKTALKMLCEDCYLELKRLNAIKKDWGRPGGLEVCQRCRQALADHVVSI